MTTLRNTASPAKYAATFCNVVADIVFGQSVDDLTWGGNKNTVKLVIVDNSHAVDITVPSDKIVEKNACRMENFS